ncbi:3-(3-hydroxy-phenyl)propionate transporter MhpT [Phenylobacterium sp. Root700]|uniref:3-(3-hydroxy-phenyl)propionate transporter MhpT n=1 Tax=Phenylobacterium sp. Root700 TaxID=1736591 RepID=UPI0009E75999|nr:3-(3-hydroxy-phenyl)propionate transporter MhpT [Phenylobacterium sp. Root700]
MPTIPLANSGASDTGSKALRTVALCLLVTIFEGIDLQAAGVAAPKIAPLFGMGPSELGWFFSASTFGLILGAAFGGALADLYGRKIVLICAVVVFGLFSIGTAHAANVEVLFGMRFLTGVGLGGALPNLIALVAENVPANRRNLAVSLMYCGMPLGGALASLSTLLGAEGGDWRMVFYIGGFAPLVAAPLLAFFLPESWQFKTLAAESGPPREGFAKALLGERRAANTLLLWLSFAFTLLVLYLLLNWLPSLLVARGLSKPEASIVQIVFNLAGAAGAVAAGALMDGRWRRPSVLLSYAGVAGCLALLAATPSTLGLSAAVGALLGWAVMATQAILYSAAPSCYPTRIRGMGVGAAVAAGRMGSAAGPLVAAVLIGAGRSPAEVLTGLLPVVIIGGSAALLLVWRVGAPSDEA